MTECYHCGEEKEQVFSLENIHSIKLCMDCWDKGFHNLYSSKPETYYFQCSQCSAEVKRNKRIFKSFCFNCKKQNHKIREYKKLSPTAF